MGYKANAKIPKVKGTFPNSGTPVVLKQENTENLNSQTVLDHPENKGFLNGKPKDLTYQDTGRGDA